MIVAVHIHVVLILVAVVAVAAMHLWQSHRLHIVIDHHDAGQGRLSVVGIPGWRRLRTLVGIVGHLVGRVLVRESCDGIVLPHARANFRL